MWSKKSKDLKFFKWRSFRVERKISLTMKIKVAAAILASAMIPGVAGSEGIVTSKLQIHVSVRLYDIDFIIGYWNYHSQFETSLTQRTTLHANSKIFV